MAETRTATRSRRSPSRDTVRTAPQPVQVVPAEAGGKEKLTDRMKEHPFVAGGGLAVGAILIYLIYKHFSGSGASAAAGSGSATGGTGTSGSGYGRGHYLGGDTGSGSGGGGGGQSGGDTSGTGANQSTVDLSGLTGLFQGLQTELGMLGQQIAGMGSQQPATSGGTSGGGGAGKTAVTYNWTPAMATALVNATHYDASSMAVTPSEQANVTAGMKNLSAGKPLTSAQSSALQTFANVQGHPVAYTPGMYSKAAQGPGNASIEAQYAANMAMAKKPASLPAKKPAPAAKPAPTTKPKTAVSTAASSHAKAAPAASKTPATPAPRQAVGHSFIQKA